MEMWRLRHLEVEQILSQLCLAPNLFKIRGEMSKMKSAAVGQQLTKKPLI